jgi:hypothetical protein
VDLALRSQGEETGLVSGCRAETVERVTDLVGFGRHKRVQDGVFDLVGDEPSFPGISKDARTKRLGDACQESRIARRNKSTIYSAPEPADRRELTLDDALLADAVRADGDERPTASQPSLLLALLLSRLALVARHPPGKP